MVRLDLQETEKYQLLKKPVRIPSSFLYGKIYKKGGRENGE